MVLPAGKVPVLNCQICGCHNCSFLALSCSLGAVAWSAQDVQDEALCVDVAEGAVDVKLLLLQAEMHDQLLRCWLAAYKYDRRDHCQL